MIAPRLEIDLEKIHHNASRLVNVLGKRGIAVTGVTKASLGSSRIANALMRAGVSGLGDSRIENIEAMKDAGVCASMTLIRSPMISQVNRVVRNANVSFNTEMGVIRRLSTAARNAGRRHGIVLMVELGDLREGIMPTDVESVVQQVLQLPNITLTGIGTNLACRSGVVPDTDNMTVLSTLADQLESTFNIKLPLVSGGNSANLLWILRTGNAGRINDLRLGEAILLGRESLHRTPILGLHTNAITLVAEVIESKLKPTLPNGTIAQSTFGVQPVAIDQGTVAQSILALGQQDTDHLGLHAPGGIQILDASSDHLMVKSKHCLKIGSEIKFQVDYGALLRAMTSPFVNKMLSTVPTSSLSNKTIHHPDATIAV